MLLHNSSQVIVLADLKGEKFIAAIKGTGKDGLLCYISGKSSPKAVLLHKKQCCALLTAVH